MKRFLIVVITTWLISTGEVSGQSLGDPRKGISVSLRETERYIAKIVNGVFTTPIMDWTTVNLIEFNGTQVMFSDRTVEKGNKFLSAGTYAFDLKDLDPNNVENEIGSVKLHTVAGRKTVRLKQSNGVTDSQDYMQINIGYPKDNASQRLANAFAHAIALAGGRIEENGDPFK